MILPFTTNERLELYDLLATTFNHPSKTVWSVRIEQERNTRPENCFCSSKLLL